MTTPWSRGHGEGQGSHDAATDPVPAPPDGTGDPVPLGYRFDVVWRGYSRRQVNEYLDMEMRWLSADRDAAVAMVCKLSMLLNESRVEARRLRERFDRHCRDPLPPDAVAERMHRFVEMARAEASDIVMKARARADHLRIEAAESVLRQETAAQHRRRRIEDDFQVAMAERRAACDAEADRILRDAEDTAKRELDSAATQLEALREMRKQLAHRLNLTRAMVARTCAMLDPFDGTEEEAADQVPSQRGPA